MYWIQDGNAFEQVDKTFANAKHFANTFFGLSKKSSKLHMFNFLLPQTVLCFAGLWLPKYAAIMDTLQDTYQDTEGQATLFTKVLSFFVTKGFVSPENIWSDSVNMFLTKMRYDVFLKGTIGAADSQQRIYMSKTAVSAIDLTVEPISNAIVDLTKKVNLISNAVRELTRRVEPISNAIAHLTERLEALENWQERVEAIDPELAERLWGPDAALNRLADSRTAQLSADAALNRSQTEEIEKAAKGAATQDAALNRLARTPKVLVDTQGDAKPASPDVELELQARVALIDPEFAARKRGADAALKGLAESPRAQL